MKKILFGLLIVGSLYAQTAGGSYRYITYNAIRDIVGDSVVVSISGDTLIVQGNKPAKFAAARITGNLKVEGTSDFYGTIRLRSNVVTDTLKVSVGIRNEGPSLLKGAATFGATATPVYIDTDAQIGINTTTPYSNLSIVPSTSGRGTGFNITSSQWNKIRNSYTTATDTSSIAGYIDSAGGPRLVMKAVDGDSLGITLNGTNAIIKTNGGLYLDAASSGYLQIAGSSVFFWNSTTFYPSANDITYLGNSGYKFKEAWVSDNIYLGGKSQTATLTIGQQNTMTEQTDSTHVLTMSNGNPVYTQYLGTGAIGFYAGAGKMGLGTATPYSNFSMVDASSGKGTGFNLTSSQWNKIRTTYATATDTSSISGYIDSAGWPRLSMMSVKGDSFGITLDGTNVNFSTNGGYQFIGSILFNGNLSPRYGDSFNIGGSTSKIQNYWGTDNIYLGGKGQTATMTIGTQNVMTEQTDSCMVATMSSGNPVFFGMAGTAGTNTRRQFYFGADTLALFNGAQTGRDSTVYILPNGDIYATGNINLVGSAKILQNTTGSLVNASEDDQYFVIDYNNNDADTRFFSWGKNSNSGPTELARLTETGYFGVGTTSPAALIHANNANVISNPLFRLGRDKNSTPDSLAGGVTGSGKWFISTNPADTTGLFNIRGRKTTLNLVDISNDYDGSLGDSSVIVNSKGYVGIGTSTAVNKLDVEGAVAIGATYSGTSTAPSNGLIVEGNTFIGAATKSTNPRFVVQADQTGTQPVAEFWGYRTAATAANAKLVSISQLNTYGIGVLSIYNSAYATAVNLAADGDSYINPQNSGSFAIGSTTPGAKLDVHGNKSTDSLLIVSNDRVHTSVYDSVFVVTPTGGGSFTDDVAFGDAVADDRITISPTTKGTAAYTGTITTTGDLTANRTYELTDYSGIHWVTGTRFNRPHLIVETDWTAINNNDGSTNYIIGSSLGPITYREEQTKSTRSWQETVTGLNIDADNTTNDEGVEIFLADGVGATLGDGWIVTGTTGGKFEVEFTVTDVSATDQLLVGWRSCVAFDDANAYANYVEHILVGITATDGSITASSRVPAIAGGAQQVDDSGTDITDGTKHTLRVEINASTRVPTAYLDGVAITLTNCGGARTTATAMAPMITYMHGAEAADPGITINRISIWR